MVFVQNSRSSMFFFPKLSNTRFFHVSRLSGNPVNYMSLPALNLTELSYFFLRFSKKVHLKTKENNKKAFLISPKRKECVTCR